MNCVFILPLSFPIKSCIDNILVATIFPDKINLNTIIGESGGYKFMVEYSWFQFNPVFLMFTIILDYLKLYWFKKN